MPMTHEELDRLMQQPEGQTLEFKAATARFGFDKLCKYCAALANEKGGRLVLGVSDRAPRRIMGTQAFRSPAKTQKKLFDIFGFRVEIESVTHSGKRVLVFQVPSRGIGSPISYDGRYWMRSGESLVQMSDDQFRRIFDEGKPDWLEEHSKTGLTPQQIVDFLDTQAYYELLDNPYPENQAEVISRLSVDRIIAIEKGAYAIRRSGALLLAKRLANFPELKTRAPRVVVYGGTSKLETRLDQFGEKGYAVGFQSLVNFIMAQLPQNEVIGEALRREAKLVPVDAIRELVANALIHQDFSVSGNSVRIEIYSDRVDISNSGLPLVDIERFIDSDQSRNERLADLMRRFGICELRGSGIDKTIHAIEVSQLPAPEFRTRSTMTSVVIYGHKNYARMDRAARIRACYQHCALMWVMNRDMNNESLRRRFGLMEDERAKISQLISQTVEEGLIKRVGASRRLARYLPHWA